MDSKWVTAFMRPVVRGRRSSASFTQTTLSPRGSIAQRTSKEPAHERPSESTTQSDNDNDDDNANVAHRFRSQSTVPACRFSRIDIAQPTSHDSNTLSKRCGDGVNGSKLRWKIDRAPSPGEPDHRLLTHTAFDLTSADTLGSLGEITELARHCDNQSQIAGRLI